MRLTASDRPGVAQPVPERDIPPQPWGKILLGALVLFLGLMTAWEWQWRAFGAAPGYRNSDGAWAEQRRRINTGEGNKTVLIGSSRMLFDVQLPEWERATGERPIQLALEGTSPLPVLEDLADDPEFTGRLVMDTTPTSLFLGLSGRRASVVPYYHEQSPSQRSGHWLSRQFLEPWFAFYDPDFALPVVVRRQAWPDRPGLPRRILVRKLSVQEIDRNTYVWPKVVNDPAYLALVRRIWELQLALPQPTVDTAQKRQTLREALLGRVTAAVAKLRARGVRVVFIRPPSSGPWQAQEDRMTPRKDSWDLLLQRTGVSGIHFEDYPQLQGYLLPEWSHLGAADAKRFTTALAPLVARELAREEGGARATAAR
ncbi:MAG: hypothetical protein H7Y19_17455 [Luteimonas sp.]|nr:hypothetical protein [Luteimonas sp.]